MTEPVPRYVTYYTHDIAANRRFYGEVLGMKLHSESPGVYFLCGSSEMKLQILAAGAQHGYSAEDPPSAGMITLGLDSQEELELLEDRLAGAGVEKLTREAPPHKFTSYSDPDGRAILLMVIPPSAG